MNDWNKDFVRVVLLDVLIAIVLIVCYSPGLLCLRPSDYSIIRAGLSIIIVPAAGIAFYFSNRPLVEQKSVRTFDGKRVRVKNTDGDILSEVDLLNDRISDSALLEKSFLCRSCIADIFVKANDDDCDITVPIVRSKLDYYLEIYVNTLERMVTLEKYSSTSLYKKSYSEISNIIELLQDVFLKALDQMLSNTLNGAELDKIVLSRMIEMDGLGENPFESLKDKYK